MNKKEIHLRNLIRYSFLMKSLDNDSHPDYIIEKFNKFFKNVSFKKCDNLSDDNLLKWRKKWKVSDDIFNKNKNIFYFTDILYDVRLTTSDLVELYNDFFYFPNNVQEGDMLHHLLEREIAKWMDNKSILRDYKLNSLFIK